MFPMLTGLGDACLASDHNDNCLIDQPQASWVPPFVASKADK